MIALISISNISQQSINKEKDLREQLDKLREQNKDLEILIERKHAMLERITTQCNEDTNENEKKSTHQNDHKWATKFLLLERMGCHLHLT